jgi:hypothetical protein
MKAKLIKESDGNYTLTLNNPKECSYSLPLLSKQNCDEIFGGFDVEKLAEKSWGDKISSPYHAYIEGFNKAMELYQPTEIEVIIEMELNMNGKNAIDRSMYIPKLDENGCLILTKKI